jgi:hypothetical protein
MPYGRLDYIMKTYKWESLKLKACQRLSSEFSLFQAGVFGELLMIEQIITKTPIKSWQDNSRALRQEAWDNIEQWDIRKAKGLFHAFPNIIPKRYRGLTPVCDLNEQGDWIVMFD